VEVTFKADHVGADGLLFKYAGPDEIADGIRTAHRGLHVRSKIVESSDRAGKVAASLTETESTVLRLIVCECLTSAQIAEKLMRSKHTVETHRRNMMAKLNAKNVLDLVQFAQSIGICKEVGNISST
jgi:DNA-binding NarL/FixJ family response regulator